MACRIWIEARSTKSDLVKFIIHDLRSIFSFVTSRSIATSITNVAQSPAKNINFMVI